MSKPDAVLAFLFLVVVCGACGLRAQDPAPADALFKKMLAAEEAKDYDAFIADGTDQLKAALSKSQFDAVCNLMNSRLKGGCDSSALGELNQKGFEVHLYRLRFKDGGDDMLATLSVKNGKVGGIFFH